MSKRVVVVTSGGFLTTKKPEEITPKKDQVLFEGTEEECNKMIHGGKK